MTIKLVEIYDTTGVGDKLKLREVYVNPDYVVAIRPDEHIKFLIESRQVIEGLDPRQSFTKIFLNRSGPGSEVTVVGDSNSIQEKLFSSKKVLKG
jgi:hypothetical protein